MNVVLISTYELGRPPFGLASPAAWLAARGHEVVCLDLSRQALDEDFIRAADLMAFHLPMHTATRLAGEQIERVRRLNSSAHICCYGLYAPMNQDFLRALGVETILGGEYETGLADLADRLAREPERVHASAVAAEASGQAEPDGQRHLNQPEYPPAVRRDRVDRPHHPRPGDPPERDEGASRLVL